MLHGQSKSELGVQKKGGSRSTAQTPTNINEAASRTNVSGSHVAQSLEFTNGVPRESHGYLDSELKSQKRKQNQL